MAARNCPEWLGENSPLHDVRSRPPDSECCVAEGDDRGEAFTAIVWGRRLSREREKPQRPRRYVTSKATRPAPLCEVPALCRGLRPYHAQKDRAGTWETSGLTGQPL